MYLDCLSRGILDWAIGLQTPLDTRGIERIIVGCTDGHVRLMDPNRVQVAQDIPVLDGWEYSLAVHPSDGSLLVGGSDGQLRAVDPSRDKKPNHNLR